jgi:dTDP-4-amino-4,6-dideoxygalactose transaminase
MSNSETLNQHLVGVPFHPFLSEDDIAFVTDSLQQLAIGL